MRKFYILICIILSINYLGVCQSNKELSNIILSEINNSKIDSEIYKSFTEKVDYFKDEINKNIKGKFSYEKDAALRKEKKGFVKRFIEENPNSNIGAYILTSLILGDIGDIYSDSELIKLTEKFNKIKSKQISKYLEKNVTLLRNLQIGEVAPEIDITNIKGEKITLSQYRGKYILLDFWASWCRGCRQEIPNLKNIYNEFKSDSFEIISISKDKSKEKWLKAIEEDKPLWVQAIESDENKGNVSTVYMLKWIPQFILLDRDGKIIKKGMRGKAIYDAVKEITKGK